MTVESSRGLSGRKLSWGLAGLVLFLMIFSQAAFATAYHAYFSVNGDTTATTFVQGDDVAWGVTCAVGDSMMWYVWYDINSNGVIDDPGDALIVAYRATDGDIASQNGPADNSATPDGRYEIPAMTFGPATGNYIFKVQSLSTSAVLTVAGTCTAMPSPPNTFSGSITMTGHPAPDALLQHHWIEADADADGSQLWSAMTDNNGHFTINVGAPGTGLEFKVKAPDLSGWVTPNNSVNTASGDVTGIVLAYTAPADSLYGTVKDLDDSLVQIPISVYCSKQDNSANKNVNITDGSYVISFSNSELGAWNSGVSSENLIPDYMACASFEFDNTSVHGIHHDFVCPKADTVMYVRVKENGGNPAHHYMVQGRYDSQGYWTQAISDTGNLNLVTLHISKHYLSGWSIQIVTWDTAYQIPSGYVLESTPSNVHPGDTATLNFVSGKMVRDTIKYDAADGDPNPDSIMVGLWSVGQSYNGSIDNNGVYTIYGDTGSYQVNLSAPGYLVKPNSPYALHLLGDTIGGLGFMINLTTCHVTGTLQNVTLPLTGTYNVFAHTGTGQNSYNSSATVNNSDGTFSLWLCDGSWTLDPPTIPSRIAPSAPTLTIANLPDSVKTANMLYSSPADVNDGSAGNALPKAFALKQNYPNPFNPSTQINYELPTAGHVELAVYDLLGRRVAMLVNEEKSAGRYTATWDGTDENGSNLASGIYFYRISSGTFSDTKKMIFLK
jgi:hypothetical protein